MTAVIIDVREPDEYAAVHYKGAINIPLSRLNAETPELKSIPQDQPVITYCRSGSRSAMALKILSSIGYTNLKNGINLESLEASQKL